MVLNVEDYLLVMWEYTESFGKVSESDISRRLKISPPTVTEYIRKIEKMGLVERMQREVRFTKSGKRITIPAVRAHRIAEVFALSVLEVPWEEVHGAVMELEHLFSGTYGDNLYKHLGFPETCPHGNPVSVVGSDSSSSALTLPEGNYVIKRIIFEDHDLLKKIADISMLPGSPVKLYKENPIVLEGENGSLKLSDQESMMIHLRKQTRKVTYSHRR
ncbi:MAG: metal-dependent transcriptional regulator [Candidatus Thermoplasmatota archaeon]|nr:metal-dependent transcriptional regulator [Candidatus Thermoplasmatota archaeon]